MTTIFSFQNISIRSYNELIFENINFSLKAGEHWAIVGESGSGKSVLLDAFAGKCSFPYGEAEYPLFDQYVSEHQSHDPLFNRHRLISQVSSRHRFTNLSNTTDLYYQQRFNSTDSEDSQTVREYLTAVRSYGRLEQWDFERLVSRLHLGHLLDKELIKLSNGETKRLLLAAALKRNPVLLLLDNPLTGLDVATREEFDELISDIASSGISIIMATSPDEIPRAITHVAVAGQGKLIQMPRADFAAEAHQHNLLPQIDTEELDDLLSLRELPDYTLIVGMENVTIRYGEKTILENVSWQIRQGERWMLLGSNGAGKSTLLSLINGDNPQAFANKIVLFDKPKGAGESIWDIKKKIGFVSPELFQYFPVGSSCMEVIESGFYDTMGLFRKPSEDKSILCRRWMGLLGIRRYENTVFRNVPVSVQRLCLLARALVKSPPLLIFDEPCQGMDAQQQERFRCLVDEICKRTKVSLIYVSHYESERPECVTKVLKLERGRVV
jgi:molybdate transport system ATP-binding protein